MSTKSTNVSKFKNLVHNSSDRASFMPGVLKAIKHVNKNPKFTLGLEDILGL